MRMMTKQADAATQSLRQRLVNRLMAPARAAKMRAHEIGEQIASSAKALGGKALDRVGASDRYNKMLDTLAEANTKHHEPLIRDVATVHGARLGGGLGAAAGAGSALYDRYSDPDSEVLSLDTLGDAARRAAAMGLVGGAASGLAGRRGGLAMLDPSTRISFVRAWTSTPLSVSASWAPDRACPSLVVLSTA